MTNDGRPTRVLISGASGLIGTHLTERMRAQGRNVSHLVRRDPRTDDERFWNPVTGEVDRSAFDGVDAVVNLSGAGIGDRRWTEQRKQEIRESRVATTALLAETMAGLRNPPAAFISQSAIGFYGERGDEVLTEQSDRGASGDFLTDVTVDWEQAATPASDAGIRVVHPRTGLVLAANTQLLGRLVPIFRLGGGGTLGDGSQWWSWISLGDQIRALTHLIDHGLSGPVNLVAPEPVTNADFTRILAEVLNRPSFLRVPRFALNLVLGEEAAEALGFGSTRVLPGLLLESGFEFRHPTLETALQHLLG